MELYKYTDFGVVLSQPSATQQNLFVIHFIKGIFVFELYFVKRILYFYMNMYHYLNYYLDANVRYCIVKTSNFSNCTSLQSATTHDVPQSKVDDSFVLILQQLWGFNTSYTLD